MVPEFNTMYLHNKLWEREFGVPIVTVSATSDLSMIAVLSGSGHITLLSSNGNSLWEKDLDCNANHLIMSSTGNRIVVITKSGKCLSGNVCVYNDEGTKIWECVLENDIDSLSVSDDGSLLTILCCKRMRGI